MKKILSILVASLIATTTMASDAPAKPEQKKVCIEQTDAKTGKTKEVCKTVKVHKKHEGTKVEGATKDEKKKPETAKK
jgi:Ni/Co efflux regulator RcnB